MKEIDAIRAAEDAYLRRNPVAGGLFVVDSCEFVSETWVVRWNMHREDGSLIREGGYIALVSETGRTRLGWHPNDPVVDAVADFEANHEAVEGEDRLPDGWTLERIKDMGIAAPALVTRPVVVMEFGVNDVVEVNPRVILELGGMCLVLGEDTGAWHVGQWDDSNTIACWGSYGADLEYAINSL